MLHVYRLGAFVLALCCVPLMALGQSPALTSFTGGTLFTSFQGDGDTVGWRFSVNRDVIVTHLGFWDGDAATQPMTLSHPVGIWNSTGTLLASNVVTPASPLTSGWRYEPITPLIITAGTYNLGAFYPTANPAADGYVSGATSVAMSPGFAILNMLRDPDGPQTGLTYPSITGAATGRFGPNILWTEIPEPASLGAVALAAVALVRRRR